MCTVHVSSSQAGLGLGCWEGGGLGGEACLPGDRQPHGPLSLLVSACGPSPHLHPVPPHLLSVPVHLTLELYPSTAVHLFREALPTARTARSAFSLWVGSSTARTGAPERDVNEPQNHGGAGRPWRWPERVSVLWHEMAVDLRSHRAGDGGGDSVVWSAGSADRNSGCTSGAVRPWETTAALGIPRSPPPDQGSRLPPQEREAVSVRCVRGVAARPGHPVRAPLPAHSPPGSQAITFPLLQSPSQLFPECSSKPFFSPFSPLPRAMGLEPWAPRKPLASPVRRQSL